MKVKAFIVYIALGIAFAAVSLWVLLSRGKSARAIRTKYRLGGAMIAAWAILSAASCEGPGPFVTCYEPVIQNGAVIYLKDHNDEAINNGDILLVNIYGPTFDRYRVKIFTTERTEPLQSETFEYTDKSLGVATFELQLSVGDYKGTAPYEVFGLTVEDGKEVELSVDAGAFTVE
ncbi:MAG: hypothetical protein J6X89_06960 [Bacteroidales bacterium]|nr:hypothetical protein [Bacteroidales bacterium]